MALKLEKNFQNRTEHSVPDVKLKGCQNFKSLLESTFLFCVKDLGVQNERSILFNRLSSVFP